MTGRALVPLLALVLPLGACIQVPHDQADSGAAGAAGASAAADAGPEGTGCGQDPYTGATLCLGLTACPGVTVNQEAFPGCGFRPTGSTTLDLECSCSGALCPIGVATSCGQAQALLAEQNQGLVCAQISEGRCLQGTTTLPPSNCDENCRGACVGDPACVTACGC
jgi:hypothetical protein